MRPNYPSTPPGRSWRILHFPLVTLIIGLAMIAGASVVASKLLVLAGIRSLGKQTARTIGAATGVIAVVVTYRLFNRYVERRPNIEYAPRGAALELGIGLLGGFLLFSAVIGVVGLLGGYRITGVDGAGGLLAAALIGVAPGFVEETITRGLIFRLVEQWLGSWAALAISAALFGAAHLANPHASLLAGVAIAIEAGVMLAALYMLTRRLWAAIGLHAAWNFTQGGVYGVPVSGFEMHGLFAQRTSGPPLLTGGAFGAEASLPAVLICTAFGAWLLVLCARRDRIVPFLPGRRAQRAGVTQL